MRKFLSLIGYESSLAKLGQLKWPCLRNDWNFYFDYITRAFSNKCRNFDALAIICEPIGYSIIYNTQYDFGRIHIFLVIDLVLIDERSIMQDFVSFYLLTVFQILKLLMLTKSLYLS